MNNCKLKDISVLITKGTTPTTVGSCFLESGINFIKAESIGECKYIDESKFQFIDNTTHNKLERSKLKEGDLLFTIAGYLGRVAIVQKQILPANINQAVAIIRTNLKKVDVEYLYYYLIQKHINRYINGLCSQSAQPNLNLELLGNIPFITKDLVIQQSIAKVLSDLDAKIEVNNKINKELEAMAKTLYDYWFVQFDFPNEDGKPYKSSGGKMVYNEDLKREIPSGWAVGKLSDFVDIVRGVSYKSDELNINGKPMVNLNSFFLDGSYKVDGIKYFSGTYNKNKLLKSNDLLIAVTDVTRNADIIGKSFILPNIFDDDDVLFSMDIAKITTDNNLSIHYLNMLFNSQPYHDFIKQFASGTLVLHLDLRAFYFFNVIIPNKDLLEKFSKLKEKIEKKKSVIIKENQQLSELRDWLLPMLMNGQVSVEQSLPNETMKNKIKITHGVYSE